MLTSAPLGRYFALPRLGGRIAGAIAHACRQGSIERHNGQYRLSKIPAPYAGAFSHLDIAVGVAPVAIIVPLAAGPEDTHAHLELVADTSPATVVPGSDPPDNLNSRILDLLSASPDTLPVAQLRSRLRIRNQRLVEALRQLSSQGKIQRTDNGYAIKPALASDSH